MKATEGSMKRILIADDDEAILDMLGNFFFDKGYAVELARDGGEVREILKAKDFDALLLDLHMPHCNGIEIIGSLRAGGNSVPVVLMSGKSTDATKENLARLGRARLVKKPFRLDDILREMEEAICELSGLKRYYSILVVDDHQETREMLATFLKESGYMVRTASSGMEALRLAGNARQPFDMAIVDLVMPDMLGDEVVHTLNEISPETLPIILTGEATNDVIGRGYRQGAHTLIRKPLDLSVLFSALVSYESSCDARRKEAAIRREQEHAPLYRKAWRNVKKYLFAKGNSVERRRATTAAVMVLGIGAGIALMLTASAVQEKIAEQERVQQEMVENLMNRIGSRIEDHGYRIENYLRRDEDRELRGVAPAPVSLQNIR